MQAVSTTIATIKDQNLYQSCSRTMLKNNIIIIVSNNYASLTYPPSTVSSNFHITRALFKSLFGPHNKVSLKLVHVGTEYNIIINIDDCMLFHFRMLRISCVSVSWTRALGSHSSSSCNVSREGEGPPRPTGWTTSRD